jgi:hypothetical protein
VREPGKMVSVRLRVTVDSFSVMEMVADGRLRDRLKVGEEVVVKVAERIPCVAVIVSEGYSDRVVLTDLVPVLAAFVGLRVIETEAVLLLERSRDLVPKDKVSDASDKLATSVAVRLLLTESVCDAVSGPFVSEWEYESETTSVCVSVAVSRRDSPLSVMLMDIVSVALSETVCE